MITATASPVEVTGQLHGEKIAMGFKADALPHLQQILSGQYSDDETACIREYASNGRDATIEAGSTRPIEVMTPNPLSPFLKIRDYGCGLDVDSIRNIFSQYGASTKRETNDQTGCLGIGSKAGLAYTSSFTVSSVKDGKRVTLSIALNDLGAGEITVIEPGAPTTDPNGTEVSIPAKRVHSFESKARALFQYWPEGSVLLNGQKVEPVTGFVLSDKPATLRLDVPEGTRDVRIDRMVIRDGNRQSVVVMGGVPYPIPDDLNKLGVPYGKSLVVWIAMGEVNFAPSREALRQTPHTQQALEAIHKHFDFTAQKAVQKSINEATTPGGALRLMFKWKGLMPERVFDHKFTYNGLDLPGTFTLSKDENGRGLVLERQPYKLAANSRQHKVMSSTGLDSVWFYNYSKDSFTPGQRKKINFWAEQQWPNFPYGDGVPEHFILVEEKPDMTFLDAAKVFDYMAVIDPIRVPRENSGGSYGPTGRIPGSYDFYEGTTYREGVPGDEIDTSYPVYYFIRDRYTEYWEATAYINKVAHFEPDCTTVVLTSNRVDKFKRLFPQTQRIQDRARALVNEWVATVDEPTKALIGFKQAVDASKFKSLAKHCDTFADPAIQATLDMIAKIENNEVLTNVEAEANLLGVPTFPTNWTDPLTKRNYPLAFDSWGSLASRNMAHIVKYINAVYEPAEAGE